MNLLDAVVTKVTGEPRQAYNKWWVDVVYDCWGRESVTAVMCSTQEEALQVKEGYKFLC